MEGRRPKMVIFKTVSIDHLGYIDLLILIVTETLDKTKY